MTSDQIRDNLKIINTFKFNKQFDENLDKDANIAIAVIVTSINKEYSHLLKMGYAIVLEYNNVFDYLSYLLMKRVAMIAGLTPIFYIVGDEKSSKLQEMFPEETIISSKKLKKIKKAVCVTGYHPIYNVKKSDKVSKYFKTILNPIQSFTPPQLNKVIEFYISSENELYTTLDEDTQIYKFYQYPIGLKDENIEFETKSIEKVYLFKLSGTEQDFQLYDEIRELTKEQGDIIFLYQVSSEEAAIFVKTNLGFYMNNYNAPNELNIIIGDNTIFSPTKTFNYINYGVNEE